MSSYITLVELHWLPITQHIDYKTLLYVYKALNDQVPVYRAYLLIPYKLRKKLKFISEHYLDTPYMFFKNHGNGAFMLVAPNLWNEIPNAIWSFKSIENFKSDLKTHLSLQAFYQ